ncbi:MAG: hypothetical protein ACRC62_12505 [Microcoleus sp.]
MQPIYITNDSFRDAIEHLKNLGGTLTKNAWLESDNTTLRIDFELAEKAFIDRIPPNDSETKASELSHHRPTRIDRTIPLNLEQSAEWTSITLDFAGRYLQSTNPAEQEKIAEDRTTAARLFRWNVIKSILEMDMIEDHIIYGGDFPQSIPFPDGIHRSAIALIHASHPANAEELHLRESQVTCDRIIRYRVPGLDDADWIRQDNQRDSLDSIGWRKLLG